MSWRDTIKKEEKAEETSWRDTVQEEESKPEKVLTGVGEAAETVGGVVKDIGGYLDDTIGAYGAGMAQGGTLGFAEEVGAGMQTALDKIFGGISDVDKQLAEQGFTGDLTPSSADVYRKAQKEEEERHEQLKKESPWAYGAGQLTGGMATAIGTGGAAQIGRAGRGAYAAARGAGMSQPVARLMAGLARTGTGAGQAAGIGAVVGAGESKGGLIGATPEEQEQLKEDIGSSALLSGALGGAAQPVMDVGGAVLKAGSKKLMESVSDMVDSVGLIGDDFIKAYREIYRQAKKGIGPLPKTSKALRAKGKGKTLYEKSLAQTKEVFNKITKADRNLSTEVGNVIKNSKEQFDVRGVLRNGRKELEDLEADFSSNPILDRFWKKINAYIKSEDGKIKDLSMEQVDRLGKELRDIKNDYLKSQNIHGDAVKSMSKTINGLFNQMEAQSPAYAEARRNLRAFRENVIEKFLYPELPPGVTEDIVKVIRSEGKDADELILDFVKTTQERKLPYKLYSEMGPEKEAKLFDAVKGVVDLSQADKKLGYPQKALLDVLGSIMGDTVDITDPVKRKEILRQSKVFQKALGMTGEEFEDMIEKAGTMAHADILTRKRTSLSPWRSTVGGALAEDIAMGGSGRELFAKGVSKAGEIASKKPLKTIAELPLKVSGIKDLPQMLKEEPSWVLDRLYKNPAGRKYAELLERGLKEGNQPLVNSAMYLLNRDQAALRLLTGEGDE